ncbi:MAG: hypothetical protein PHP82_03225 [Candidatus ainarchaeum sp.]|nr:hypothetical protein [Candidatus ainarchaeum sp.]
MVELKTELNPFRIVLGHTKNIELMVQIKNDSDKERTISCDIILGNNLGFEKNCLSNTRTLRLGKLKPNEKKINYFKIFPKATINRRTEQPIFISVMEHFEEKYDYILSKKSKQLFLRIE